MRDGASHVLTFLGGLLLGVLLTGGLFGASLLFGRPHPPREDLIRSAAEMRAQAEAERARALEEELRKAENRIRELERAADNR